MLIWKSYRQEGQCSPLLGHKGICLCLPRSPTRRWTSLHPVKCSSALYYCHAVAGLRLRRASRFLRCKHRAVWRRSFRTCRSETHWISAESGCGCNILSAKRGKHPLRFKERACQSTIVTVLPFNHHHHHHHQVQLCTWLFLPLFRQSFFCSGEASQSICKQLGGVLD